MCLLKLTLTAFNQQRQMKLSIKNKTEGFAHATFNDLAKTFEVVMEQLEHAHEVSGIQLAYVPRKKLIPLDEDDDPPTNYLSLDAKAIAHAPILEDVLPSQASLRQPLHCLRRTVHFVTPSTLI
jgi:hypothetical protein